MSATPISVQCWPAETVPVVSVLVRAYNHHQFLAQCLQSILDQVTDFSVEIIVHDDASTDGTAAIVAAYAEKYPQLIKPVLQTENQYAQQKKCLPILHKLARGEFIACCDGDDAWTDTKKLDKQVGFLRSNPDYVLGFHDATLIDSSGRVLRPNNLTDGARRDYSKDELREMKWGWMLLGTLCYRNVDIEFPPEFNFAPNGDNFLPILLAAHGGAKFLADVGSLAYRIHEGGIWSSKSHVEMARMNLQSYLQITAYFVRIGELATARNIIAGKLNICVTDFFNETSKSP